MDERERERMDEAVKLWHKWSEKIPGRQRYKHTAEERREITRRMDELAGGHKQLIAELVKREILFFAPLFSI